MHIIIVIKENPFAAYGANIVGNIIIYTNSNDEEEEAKKQKDQKQPAAHPKGKKIAKPSPKKTTTRADTRATTKVEKEQEKKKTIEQGDGFGFALVLNPKDEVADKKTKMPREVQELLE